MTESRLNLAIIIGSTREGRFAPAVGEWFARQARERDDMNVDVIDLLDADLPAMMPARNNGAIAAYTERLARADAFVVVTPEYNHGYPASLKQGIDLAHSEWQAKPVGFVSYGGMSGGLRAVEQLRQVFAELHAPSVRDQVSFHNGWNLFGETSDATELRGANAAASAMLDQLAWWGVSLREAREQRPYAA